MTSLNADFYSLDELKSLGVNLSHSDILISKRATLVGVDYIEFGSHVRIDPYCVITAGHTGVHFGNYVHIGAGCVLIGAGGIHIDNFVTVSHQCILLSATDDFSGKYLVGATVPEELRQVTKAPVICEPYSFVGVNSVVFPGVTLAEGTAVGAGSLVRYSLEPWKIYAGNPLRLIRDRNKDLEVLASKLAESV